MKGFQACRGDYVIEGNQPKCVNRHFCHFFGKRKTLNDESQKCPFYHYAICEKSVKCKGERHCDNTP